MSSNNVRYRFEFGDGSEWRCEVAMDSEYQESSAELPEWTRLGFCQCSHCPLSTAEVRYCPYAVALLGPAKATADRPSHEPVSVSVNVRDREVRAETTLQRAMGSLLGLIGPFSGCPVTAILRPMARYHLPLSSPEETVVRAFSTYLLGQYLRDQHNENADWSMQGLRRIYADLRQLNLGMSQRLRASQKEDAGVNSFVLLDLLAADVGYALDQYEGELDESFGEFLSDASRKRD
ncbi:MAG: hypothetical protein KA296_15725 [Marinobacter sp.]|nr:hypothetical protein [Marinobacter sp.]